MISLSLVALLAAAPQGPPAPWLLVVPAPQRTLPRLPRFLDWAALPAPELTAERATRRGMAVLGLDPLSPAALVKAGIDGEKALLLWFDPDRDFSITELAVRDSAQAERFVAGVAGRVPRARHLKGGFIVGEHLASALAVVLGGDRLWVLLGGAYTPSLDPRPPPSSLSTELEKEPIAQPLVIAQRYQRPVLSKSLSGAAEPELWGALRLPGAIQRIDWAVELGGDGSGPVIGGATAPPGPRPDSFRLRAEVDFGPESGLALGEGLASRGKRGTLPAATLVRGSTAAADLRLVLTGAGLASILDRAGLPKSAAKCFTGVVQLLLAPSGGLAALAELVSKPDRAELSGLSKALAERYPGATTKTIGGPKPAVFAAWVGDIRPEALSEAIAPAGGNGALALGSPGAASRAPVELIATPTRLFSALKARSGTPDRLGPRAMDLMMLRFVLRPWFDGTQSVRAALLLPDGRPRLELEVELVPR